MKVLCLHGLVPSGAPKPTGAPAHWQIPLGRLTALVSDQPQELDDETASLEAILSHDLLLASYLAADAVLPVRFGTCFSDEAALTKTLRASLTVLNAQLQKLRGVAEYALTVEPGAVAQAVEPGPQPVTSGREFLKARKVLRDQKADVTQGRSEQIKALHDVACQLAVDDDLRPPRAPRLLSLSLLMDRQSAAQLEQHLSGIAPSLAARLTGPFPAYSFAGVFDGGAGHAV